MITVRSRTAWLWGFFIFAIFWGAAFGLLVYRFEVQRDRETFLETRRRLFKHTIEDVTDALTVGDDVRLNTLLQRMAGEESGRYAIWAGLDASLKKAGDEYFLGSVPDKKFAEQARNAEQIVVLESDDCSDTVELAGPVSVQGKRAGVLRWGVWTTAKAWNNQKIFMRIFAAWAWLVLVGCGAVYWLSRRMAQNEVTAP